MYLPTRTSINHQSIIIIITDILEPVSPPAPKRCNLLLHCGSHAVSRSELAEALTPRPTRSWQPIPHIRLLQIVERALFEQGLSITSHAHGLTHDGARYFGLLEVRGFAHHSEYSHVVGLRNSHDMRFSAGLVAGSQVLVCDNLSFSGEIQIARKHTSRILQDLPDLIASAVSQLKGYWMQHSHRVLRYKEVFLSNEKVHDLVIRSVDAEVIPNRMIPNVLELWRTPLHEEFTPRTLWSLQNTFTEALKGRLQSLPHRTEKLHQMFDVEADLN